MASIKSRDTKFEIAFLELLSAQVYPKGHRYRKHYRGVTGNPDLAFVKHKLAVFLDSDFWHGRNYKKLEPRLKNEFWRTKIKRNISRDKEVNRALRNSGWTVLRLGEKQIKKDAQGTIKHIISLLERQSDHPRGSRL